MKSVLFTRLAAALAVLMMFYAVYDVQRDLPGDFPEGTMSAVLPAPPETGGLPLAPQKTVVNDGGRMLVHAASAVETDNDIRAFWFTGSREGGRDVVIAGNTLREGQWQLEQVQLTVPWLQQQAGRRVRKLGNVAPIYWGDDHLSLIAVSVSAGGWAGSQLNWFDSFDGGNNWQWNKRLVTSPAANLSTLVKTAPLTLHNGEVWLPVYHEFLNKFSELLRVDASGEIHDKVRLGHGRMSLQPGLLLQDENQMLAYSRNAAGTRPRMAWLNHSSDAGQSWSAPMLSEVPNPNSALATLKLPQGYLMVANNNEVERDDLTVLWSADGLRWQTLVLLEDAHAFRGVPLQPDAFREALQKQLPDTLPENIAQRILDNAVHNKCRHGECEFQFDYPYALLDKHGDIHIFYTWNKSAVMHVRFSLGWVQQQLAAEGEAGV